MTNFMRTFDLSQKMFVIKIFARMSQTNSLQNYDIFSDNNT
jgi:hypothetical protein